MEKNKIVITVSTARPEEKDSELIEKLKKRCGIEPVFNIVHNNDGKSLTSIYNSVIEKYKNDGDTLLLFIHDDVDVVTKNWGEKLLSIANSRNDAIIGIAGTEYFGDDCMWWSRKDRLHGVVAHRHEGKVWVSKFGDGDKNKYNSAVAIDGLFFAVNTDHLNVGFDESFSGFDFYDVTFCIDNVISGAGVGITTEIHVIHNSIGQMKPNWYVNRALAMTKYENVLPVDIKRLKRR